MSQNLISLLVTFIALLLHFPSPIHSIRNIHIIGGGIGGLTAAHELAQLTSPNDTMIHIYERSSITLGGKARSIRVDDTGIGGREDLWGEHGYRIFPKSVYHHFEDTMNKIDPDIWKKRLVADEKMMFATASGEPVVFTTPHSLLSFLAYIKEIAPAMEKAGCPRNEIFYVAERILVLCESCIDRYDKQYDEIRFWDFVHADELHPATQETFIKLITSGILAADPKLASLRTIGKLLVRMFIKYHNSMVNNLNGPTTVTLIEPWVRKITSYPHVNIHMDHNMVGIESVQKRIESVTFTHSESNDTTTITNSGDDMIIVAIPAERMAEVLKKNPDVKRDAPSLSGVEKLFVNNQNGLQFFLKEDIPMIRGHVSYTYSKWAITSISQAQFWDYDWSHAGDGTVKGVLSVDVSTWNLPGEPDGPSRGRTGEDVDRETFIAECWYQMHKSLPGLIPRNMSDVVHTAFLDPDVAINAEGKLEGLEPLFINTVNANALQPNSHTEISNLFLASDYTATDFNVACMESANESARRATNALLERIGSSARSKIYTWPWPIEFLIPQKLDCMRFKDGKMPIGWDKKPKDFTIETSLLAKYAAQEN